MYAITHLLLFRKGNISEVRGRHEVSFLKHVVCIISKRIRKEMLSKNNFDVTALRQFKNSIYPTAILLLYSTRNE